MKKLIIALLCILSIVAAYSQDSVLVKVPAPTVVDTSKLSAKMVYDDAKEGIKGLAKALKAPAEHVYSVLIKQ